MTSSSSTRTRSMSKASVAAAAAHGLVIEKNVPLPDQQLPVELKPANDDKRVSVAAVIREMKKGDSLFVTAQQNAKGTSCFAVARELNRKFLVRPAEKDGVKGWRIWRQK